MKEWFMENYAAVAVVILCLSPFWLGIIIGILHKIQEKREGRNANTRR